MAKSPRGSRSSLPDSKAATAKARLGPAVFAAGVVLFALMIVWWLWPKDSERALPSPSHAGKSSERGIAAVKLPPLLEPESEVFAKYAGSRNCRDCHREAYDAWRESNHALAERMPDGDMDKRAFDPKHVFRHGSQESSTTTKDGLPVVVTNGFENRPEAYPVARVIGHDPLRQFLVGRPGGRFQTLEVAYDPHKNEWFDVYGNEDRKPGEWGHWTGRGMTWNSMCASCHNTRLRKNYDEATDTYRTAMAEMSVGCESCHGPMKAHVDWRRSHPQSKEPDPTVKKPDRDQVSDTCGSCHARRRELTGDFVPGDAFGQHFQLTTVDESDLYFADGQVRDELYEFGSFLGSKMHAAGVRCVDCHDPHRAKPRLAGNNLCMRCHTGAPQQIPGSAAIAPVVDPVAHSFHQAGGAGAQCVSCHMPVTTYMQRHPRHDHAFTIPDPLLTKQHGIPNACNRCHVEKDADWALAASERWWGEKMKRPARERAQRIAAARSGDVQAGEPLLALLRGEANPFWKASLIRVSGAWADNPGVAQAFIEYAQHPDPLVRTAAVQALEPLARSGNDAARQTLLRRLEDAQRCVRVAAESSLREPPDPASRAGREAMHATDLGADQPLGQMQKGAREFARGDSEGALRHFEKAVAWDANSGGIRHEYAILLSSLGRAQDALRQMQEAVRLEPRQPEFRYKLALAWNEAGDLKNVVRQLEEAVKLDARHANAWYNLGLARNEIGLSEDAVSALREAESANPSDPRIPYARATIHARLRQDEKAREAARRALQLRPDHQEAKALLQSLQR